IVVVAVHLDLDGRMRADVHETLDLAAPLRFVVDAPKDHQPVSGRTHREHERDDVRGAVGPDRRDAPDLRRGQPADRLSPIHLTTVAAASAYRDFPMPHFGLQLPSFTFPGVPDAELFGQV